MHLDGLRGLAILAVVFYHAYSRWPEAQDLYTPVFARGHLGVQLFFLLSGFLIFHSLEASGSFAKFLYRRWVRLFPAMVVVSWFVFTTASYFYNRVEGLPGWRDLLPGLSLIEPHWWRDWLGVSVTGPVEGDFWTLFTEVKFYVLFGLAFSVFRRRAVLVLVAVAVYGLTLQILQGKGIHQHLTLALADELNAPCYGWFAAGALLYLHWDSGQRAALVGSILLAVIAVLANSSLTNPLDLASGAAVYGIFLLPFFLRPVRDFFSLPLLAFFGFISYPLYLIHENATWAAIVRLHDDLPALPSWLLPLLPMTAAGMLAWVVAEYLEPLGRSLLRPTKNRRPSLTLGPALACLGFAAVAALLVTLSLYRPVRPKRVDRESEILRSERNDLAPLEAKVADGAQELAAVRQARIEAEAYLAAMHRPGSP